MWGIPKPSFCKGDLYTRQSYLGEKTDNGTIQCVHSPCGIYVIKLLLRNKQNIVMPSTAAAAAAKSLQSCPTLHDPIDNGPPGSPIPGILQARTLEWVAISFSSAWKRKVKVKLLRRVQLRDPMDCSPPGSSVHGIFQARGLEWGAIAFSIIPEMAMDIKERVPARWVTTGLARQGNLATDQMKLVTWQPRWSQPARPAGHFPLFLPTDWCRVRAKDKQTYPFQRSSSRSSIYVIGSHFQTTFNIFMQVIK